jgi:hypothetical protein
MLPATPAMLPATPATLPHVTPSPLCYASAPSPTLQQKLAKVASVVAWERRERGGSYYTRSRRRNGRVLREYVGTGPFAEIIAASDRTRRELNKAEREEEKDRQRHDRERLEALAAPIDELSEAAEVLVRAHLVAAGYHKYNGEWRRARSA